MSAKIVFAGFNYNKLFVAPVACALLNVLYLLKP